MLTLTVLILSANIIFYVFMMFFSWIITSIAHARKWEKFDMIVFWPFWVIPEARKGDPFLIWASIIFVVLFIATCAVLWLT